MSTAVAAPAQPPFEDMFETIDQMTVTELLRFTLEARLRLLRAVDRKAMLGRWRALDERIVIGVASADQVAEFNRLDAWVRDSSEANPA